MRRTLAVLLIFLLIMSLGITQVFAVYEGEAEDEGCPMEGEDPEEEEEFANKYLWRIAHLESIAARTPGTFGFGLTRAIANAYRQLQRAVEQGKVAPVEGDEESPDWDIVIIIDDETENGDGENDEEENGQTETDETEKGEGEEEYGDKYLWRIAHLTTIPEGAPEGARFGLTRAIANAHRQRQKALEQGRIVEDDQGEEEGSSGEEAVEISSSKGPPPGKAAKPGGPPAFVKKK